MDSTVQSLYNTPRNNMAFDITWSCCGSNFSYRGNLQRNYSKTCLKRPLKNRQIKFLMTNGSLIKVESIAPIGAFCNTFNLHYAIIGLENHF